LLLLTNMYLDLGFHQYKKKSENRGIIILRKQYSTIWEWEEISIQLQFNSELRLRRKITRKKKQEDKEEWNWANGEIEEWRSVGRRRWVEEDEGSRSLLVFLSLVLCCSQNWSGEQWIVLPILYLYLLEFRIL
jgi:hypothetical protein